MKKAVLPLSLSALLLMAFQLSSTKKIATEDAIPPNIIFFLIDDLGMMSTPPYTNGTDSGMIWHQDWNTKKPAQPGIPYKTPNIYNFSKNAMVLTNMYATPSCAPSRAQLMSGLYPFETGITWPAYGINTYLRKPTYVELLNKPEGGNYFSGFGGKWNLKYGISDYQAIKPGEIINNGKDTISYLDLAVDQMNHLTSCGFEETFGQPMYNEKENKYEGGIALIGNTVDYYPGGEGGPFFPDTLHTWAKNFIKQGVKRREAINQPFYLHYALGLIHDAAYSQNEAFGPNYKMLDGQPRRVNILEEANWADKMEYADSLIGDLLTTLINSDSSVYNNTVIIIAGDNGTEHPYYAQYQNQILEGGKLTYNTWGSRVPFMIRWPNQITTGTYDGLTDFSDIFSTIVEGIVQTDNPIKTHGQSFFDQIKIDREVDKNPRRAVYSQMKYGAFVANERYQYRVNTSTQQYSENTVSGLYQVHTDPLSNTLIYSNEDLLDSIAVGKLDDPSIEWRSFDTLYSYLCYLEPTVYNYDSLQICKHTAIETLVTDYWSKAGD